MSSRAAEYSKVLKAAEDEKVLINELCAPNFETGMRMESSLFFNAGTKLQVMADTIDSDA